MHSLRAHSRVYLAKKSGLITKKEQCEKCGAPSKHAHHEDYSKPLDVIWLCQSCHRKRHSEMRANGIAPGREESDEADGLLADGLLSATLLTFFREGGINHIVEKVLREREQYLTAKEGAAMLHVTLKIFRGLKLPRAELTDQTFRYKRSDIQAELERRMVNPKRKGKP